jgi:hypothetical protein
VSRSPALDNFLERARDLLADAHDTLEPHELVALGTATLALALAGATLLAPERLPAVTDAACSGVRTTAPALLAEMQDSLFTGRLS